MTQAAARATTGRDRRLWRLPLLIALGSGLLAGSALGSHPTAHADAITDQIAAAQQQLKNEASANAQIKAEIADDQTQLAQLDAAIHQLDAQIAANDQAIALTTGQLQEVQGELLVAQQNLAWTRSQEVTDRRTLAREIVVLYEASGQNTDFNNFLSKGDFNSFFRHELDLSRLSGSLRSLVTKVDAEAATEAADVAAIAAQKQEKATLLATQQQVQVQQAASLQNRQAALTAYGVKLAQENALLAANEQSQKDVANQIASLQAEEAAALAAGGGHGQFSWPLSGVITQGFGCTSYPFEPYDPQCPSRHFHSGIDIAAACGTDVAAADAGIAHTYVSDYGYGNHILIDHGNGWVTLYGHLAAFNVGDGQTVQRGQVVGFEGSSGNSTGCHVHFEIDHYGTPQNPMNYLP
ncbi:MAG: murein hydrolase activator EnvC family protein [Candidatus Dormibacteria bacterium]